MYKILLYVVTCFVRVNVCRQSSSNASQFRLTEEERFNRANGWNARFEFLRAMLLHIEVFGKAAQNILMDVSDVSKNSSALSSRINLCSRLICCQENGTTFFQNFGTTTHRRQKRYTHEKLNSQKYVKVSHMETKSTSWHYTRRTGSCKLQRRKWRERRNKYCHDIFPMIFDPRKVYQLFSYHRYFLYFCVSR
jgi:hypothetical protein